MIKPVKLTIATVLTLLPQLAFAQVCDRDGTPPTAPTSRFSINGETVLDTYSGKTWLRCAIGYSWNAGFNTCVYQNNAQRLFTWGEALTTAINTANSQLIGGSSAWRLPTLKELVAILDYQCIAPPMNQEVFPDTPASATRGYWTSTPHLTEYGNSASPSAWFLNLTTGQAEIKRLYSATGTEDTDNFVILVHD